LNVQVSDAYVTSRSKSSRLITQDSKLNMIPQEIIDQILDRLDIVEVISGLIPLKKTGRNFKACCPFHNEKTPSFVVSPDKQIYHCFGCGEGGNAIGFVMKYESMDFPEVIKILAAKAGVELPEYRKESGEGPSISSRLYEVNKLAASFYQNYLRTEKGKRAFKYLQDRGISPATLSEFRVGYAPDEWESFKKFSQSKKVPSDLVKRAGLSISSEKGKGDYDRFRNRIIFPVFNERGHIIAFGGRVMDNSLPKYINSPETSIYSKSNVLYGINFSRKGIRDKGCAVIVEGYMDVIIPFQAGVTNVVATSGTALTPRQVDILKKYTDTVVMVFDSDQAGIAASLRGLDILLEKGMKVKIASLPEGEDPDSYVRKNGSEKFEEIIAGAKGLFDYKLDLLISKLGIKDIGGIVDEMLPTMAKVESEVIKSYDIKRLASRLGLHEQSLRHEMKKVKPDYSHHYEPETTPDRNTTSYSKSEVHLLGLAMLSRKSFLKIRENLGLDQFMDSNIIKVLTLVADFYDKDEGDINAGKLLSRLENEENAKEAALQAFAQTEITQDMDQALNECIACLRKENWDKKYKELTSKLKKAHNDQDKTEVDRLVVKIDKIIKEKVV